jgi:nucleotidyltransferase/DNA polymerase involved in DNA repair
LASCALLLISADENLSGRAADVVVVAGGQCRRQHPSFLFATDAAKGTGFLEVPAGQEKAFLKDRPVSEMSGIGTNRERYIKALGALTFGHVAQLPSMLLKQKFGIWGQQLWLFSNGQWNVSG